MSAAPKYTERDLVLAKRGAYACGYGDGSHWFTSPSKVQHIAIAKYPLPEPTTRPRVVKDKYGIEWRLSEGRLEWKSPQTGDEWQGTDKYGAIDIGQRRIEVWADLLLTPTEEVEE